MLIFHYIMEYFGKLSGPCPIHEQPKDEIIINNAIICVLNSLIIRSKHFAGNFNPCVITIIYNFMTKVSKRNIC